MSNLLAEPPTAPAARALHLRRQLEAATEHGVALLAALGLPRLVEPDFVPIDMHAAGDAVALAIDTLDALDADADLEDDEREIPEDDEHSLGWREAVGQVDLGHGSDDAEHSLGAPERHPPVTSLGSPHHEPAAGGRQFRPRSWASQASWAQGSRVDGEGESEPGYDLGCGSEHDGAEPDTDGEPNLGSLEVGDQTAWGESGTTDREVDENGGFGTCLSNAAASANAAAAREAGRQARALRQRIKGAPRRDPDEVVFLAGLPPGTALWRRSGGEVRVGWSL